MAEWMHRHARINGIRTHYVEQGEGPLIILVHGFPHLWYSWRHQIPAIAAAGWQVVAPDLRGMGQTEAPADPALYDCDHTVGDLIGLLDHLGAEKAVFAGLDFGVFAIYDLAVRHPDRVAGIIGLQNPHTPHLSELSPLKEAAEMAARHFSHIHYFVDEPGVADAALDADPRDFLKAVLWGLSGAHHLLDMWNYPPGTAYRTALPDPPPLPWAWMSECDMEYYVSEYSRSGFTGGLNWYRAMDLRWQQRRAFEGVKTEAPYFFIGTENDVDLEGFHGDDPLGAIKLHHGDIRAVEMLPGAGHLVQMEQPEAVTGLMLKFLETLR